MLLVTLIYKSKCVDMYLLNFSFLFVSVLCRPKPFFSDLWQQRPARAALCPRHTPSHLHWSEHRRLRWHRLRWPDPPLWGAEEEDLNARPLCLFDSTRIGSYHGDRDKTKQNKKNLISSPIWKPSSAAPSTPHCPLSTGLGVDIPHSSTLWGCSCLYLVEAPMSFLFRNANWRIWLTKGVCEFRLSGSKLYIYRNTLYLTRPFLSLHI